MTKALVLAFLLTTLLCTGVSETNNPAYLHEGFNGTSLPPGWRQVRLAGTQASWSVVGTGSNPTVPPYAGTGQAKFNSFDAASGEQARLGSPAINLTTATDPFITFHMYHEDEYLSSVDSVYVEATTGDSINGPWTTLHGVRRPRQISGWTKEIVSLFAYRGVSRIYLSLRGVSRYGNNIYVDEFRVADSSFHDIGVVAVMPANIPTPEAPFHPTTTMNSSRTQSASGSAKLNSTQPSEPIVAVPYSPQLNIRAVVRNTGTFSESSYSIGWRINAQAQPQVAGRPISARTGSDTLTLVWTTPTAGIHTLTAWTSLASDSNRANDTARVTFQVLESGTVFYESFNDNMFPPSGWSVINRDGGPLVPWFRGADTSAFVAFEGSGFAANNFQRTNGTYLDDYLITPSVAGIGQAGSKDSLIFWTRSQFNQPPAINFPDSLMVLASTTGIDTANFTIMLDYFAVPKTGWSRRAYSLHNRVPPNSTVRLAFRYLLYNVGPTSGSGDFIGIDAVQVLRIAPSDVHPDQTATVDFRLLQNYPNPFNPTTSITFTTPHSSLTSLRVFDMLGREVVTLLNRYVAAGTHSCVFDASLLSSGVYYYRLQSGTQSKTKSMLLLR
jgi:hypothetical protein